MAMAMAIAVACMELAAWSTLWSMLSMPRTVEALESYYS